jgi:hypothetical protein
MPNRTIAARHITHIIFFSDLHAIRFVLFVAELIWSLSLFFHSTSFDRQIYSIMAEIAPEMAWALLFGGSAMIQLFFMLTQNYFSREAQVFAGWNAAFWILVVISMYNSMVPPPSGLAGEIALTLGACWVFVRSGYKTRV